MHVDGIGIKVDTDQQDLFFIEFGEGENILMDSVDVFSSHRKHLARCEKFQLFSQFAAMAIMFVNFSQIEAELWADLPPESFLEVFNLGRILDCSICA